MSRAYNKFRVRRTWFGKCILQQLRSYPALIGGTVDSSIRSWEWVDVNYDKAPEIFVIPEEQKLDVSTEQRQGSGDANS